MSMPLNTKKQIRTVQDRLQPLPGAYSSQSTEPRLKHGVRLQIRTELRCVQKNWAAFISITTNGPSLMLAHTPDTNDLTPHQTCLQNDSKIFLKDQKLSFQWRSGYVILTLPFNPLCEALQGSKLLFIACFFSFRRVGSFMFGGSRAVVAVVISYSDGTIFNVRNIVYT